MRTAEDTPAELAYQTYGVLDEARCKAQEALDAAEHRADLAKALLDSTLYTIGTGPQSRPQVRRRVGKAVRLLASYKRPSARPWHWCPQQPRPRRQPTSPGCGPTR
jgi:hypothetical protein